MSGRSINFENKNIKKSDFYKNKKKLFKIEKQKALILIKYLSLKKNHMIQKMLLNTLLGIMTLMKLNQYV